MWRACAAETTSVRGIASSGQAATQGAATPHNAPGCYSMSQLRLHRRPASVNQIAGQRPQSTTQARWLLQAVRAGWPVAGAAAEHPERAAWSAPSYAARAAARESHARLLTAHMSRASVHNTTRSSATYRTARTTPHRTAPHRTAPHRTAPHHTAPHRTAPHRTAPRRPSPSAKPAPAHAPVSSPVPVPVPVPVPGLASR